MARALCWGCILLNMTASVYVYHFRPDAQWYLPPAIGVSLFTIFLLGYYRG